MFQYSPKFILVSKIFDSRKKMILCPYHYTNNYRIVLNLYEMGDQ